MSEAYRAQMPAVQFVIAFNFYYIYLQLRNRWVQRALLALCLLVAFHQGNVTANLLYSDHVKFEEDVALAQRLNVQLDSMGVGERKPVSSCYSR